MSSPIPFPTAPSLALCELTDASAWGVESFSPFCLKVHRALKVSGLAYARRHGAQPGAFKALNPTGQVPVLLVDGAPVADSSVICARLAELAPGRIARDPEALLYEELADTALNGFLVASRWADEENWPRTREAFFEAMPRLVRRVVPDRLRKGVMRSLVARDVWRAGPDACWERLCSLLDALDARAPERGFWCGDALSIADIALFAQLQSLRTPLTPRQRTWVESRGRLTRWLERVDRATQQPRGHADDAERRARPLPCAGSGRREAGRAQ